MSGQTERWITQLEDPDPSKRCAAAENLSYLEAEAADAAIQLVQACQDTEDVREWAVAALEGMGPPRVEDKRKLSELSKASEPLVAYWAVTLLGRLGSVASSEQASLAAMLSAESTDETVKERIVWAIGRMDLAPEVVPVLKNLTQTGAPRISGLAREALSKLPAGSGM